MTTLLAGFFAAVFAYLAVGFLTGYAPRRLDFRLGARRPRAKPTPQAWLRQAGAAVTPWQFWGSSLGAGALALVVVSAVAGSTFVALPAAIAVGGAPRAYFARKRRAVARARVEAWPDALRSVVGSLSASLSLHQGLVEVASSGPVPLRPVLARYAHLTATLDQRGALEAVREELADPVSDRVLEVVILAAEQGPGVVTSILRDLAEATTRDLQLAEKVETASLEQRLNARAVAVLPYVILVGLCASDGQWRSFYATPAGLVVVVVGGAMSLGGMALVRRLGRERPEERVLAAAGGRP